jgi:hypothetical protein
MTTFPETPCMSNNDRSLDSMQMEQAALKAQIDALVDDGQEVPDELAAAHRKLRMGYHPDHWFMDPGSGRETEAGRLRRRALQACWADCPMKARLLCLDRGLQEGPTLQYGIYGGYTEKQRQEIVTAREAHRASHAE